MGTFFKRLKSHPGFLEATHPFIIDVMAQHPYCLASQACIQHVKAVLHRRSHRLIWQKCNVYDFSIGPRQWPTLLCRGAVCAVLVLRLMRFQGEYGVRNVIDNACSVILRRHFLVSKNAAETLFLEGHRLCREEPYSEAVRSWGMAALLQHLPSHAFASSLLLDSRVLMFESISDRIRLEKRALDFASCGAALHCPHSKGALGRCYVFGSIEKDLIKGLALARESADEGSCFGQFVLGRCYDEGLGVVRDSTEAVRMYHLSAEQGYANAQYSLGFIFSKGKGVPKDYTEAVRWYRLAAEQGLVYAQYALGYMFHYGRGVEQNYAEAVRWYQPAAAQRYEAAQYNLDSILFRV
jgi:TPR repeat protein